MGAQFFKNDAVAARRRCYMKIFGLDGVTPANRGDASTGQFTGFLYVSKSSPDAVAATGTITNRRKAWVIADDVVEATNTGAPESTQLTAHGLETGDGPLRPTTTLGGFVAGTDYWVIKIDANNVSWATTLAFAYAGTKLNITADVTGMVFQDVVGVTQRGIDGQFIYEAPQAEINFDGSEFIVSLEKPASYAPSETSVAMGGANGFDAIMEGAYTYGDDMRLVVRDEVAKFSKVGNDFVKRNLADTKDSHSGTVTSAGRTASVIIDPTP